MQAKALNADLVKGMNTALGKPMGLNYMKKEGLPSCVALKNSIRQNVDQKDRRDVEKPLPDDLIENADHYDQENFGCEEQNATFEDANASPSNAHSETRVIFKDQPGKCRKCGHTQTQDALKCEVCVQLESAGPLKVPN